MHRGGAVTLTVTEPLPQPLTLAFAEPHPGATITESHPGAAGAGTVPHRAAARPLTGARAVAFAVTRAVTITLALTVADHVGRRMSTGSPGRPAAAT